MYLYLDRAQSTATGRPDAETQKHVYSYMEITLINIFKMMMISQISELICDDIIYLLNKLKT